MNTKTAALKAQEQLVYRELTRYVELVASFRDQHSEEFLDLEKRNPAFMILAASQSRSGHLLMSAHTLTPASMRQNHMGAIEMSTAINFGITSAAAALAANSMRQVVPDVIETAEEMADMNLGIGHA